MPKVSVLLADDDKLILENIAKRIDWNRLGFEIVGTAPNGALALALYQKLRPELVVTDVIMPVMNGLELTRAIRGEDPHARILLVSSYEEFDYVKKALEFGATGYVLKSELFEEAFIARLRAFQAEIFNDMSLGEAAVRAELERYFSPEDLTSIVIGSEKDARKNAFDRLVKHFPDHYSFCFFFEITPFSLRGMDLKDDADRRLDCEKRLKLLLDMESAQVPLSMCFSMGDILAVGVRDAQDFEHMCKAYAEKLAPGFRKRFSWIYTQEPVSLEKMREMLRARMNSLRLVRRFLPERPLELKSLPDDHRVSEKFAYIRLIDERADFKAMSESIEKYLRNACAHWDYSAIEAFLLRFAIQMETLTSFRITLPEFCFFSNAQQLIAWAVETYGQCLEMAEKSSKAQYTLPVREAVHYMWAHYASAELRTEEIARFAAMSPSRLHVIFKKETGKTLNDYLTDLRINQAIQLLENSQMKVYEIAEAVGYSSSQYFSQVLYQRTGKRPLDYRRATADV